MTTPNKLTKLTSKHFENEDGEIKRFFNTISTTFIFFSQALNHFEAYSFGEFTDEEVGSMKMELYFNLHLPPKSGWKNKVKSKCMWLYWDTANSFFIEYNTFKQSSAAPLLNAFFRKSSTCSQYASN